MGTGSCGKSPDESSLLNHPDPSSCAEVVPVWAFILKLGWQQVYMYVLLDCSTYHGIWVWKLDSPWFDPPVLYTYPSGVPPLADRQQLTAPRSSAPINRVQIIIYQNCIEESAIFYRQSVAAAPIRAASWRPFARASHIYHIYYTIN